MPRLPTKYDLGAPARLDPQHLSNPDTGAGQVGRGVEAVGGAVEGIAEQEARQRDALDAAKWEAARRPQYESLVDQFHRDPDYKSFEPRFKEAVAKIDNDASGIVQNPQLRERLKYKAQVEADGALRRVLTHGNQLRRQDEYAQADDAVGAIASPALSPDATPEDAAETVRQAQAHLDNLKNTGALDPAQAHHLQDKHITGLSGVLPRIAANRLWSDPYGTLTDLGVAAKVRPNASATGGNETLDFIKAQEGFSPVATKDYKQYSSGYGTKAVPGETITREEAQKRLEAETAKISEWVGNNIEVPLNRKQFTALASFGYNLGTGKGGLEDLKDDINAGDWDRVASRMQTFNRAGGQVSPGLVKRRRAEADLLRAGAKEPPPEQGGSASDEEVIPEGDRAPAMPDKGSPWVDLYSRMSPVARAHLITNARIALSDTTQRDLKDAAAEAARTGVIPADETGQTALDRARTILTPNQLSKANGTLDEAVMGFKATAPLASMTEDEAYAHLGSLAPSERRAKGERYASAAKVYDKAAKDWQTIKELRTSDPVKAISGGNLKRGSGPQMSVAEDGSITVRQDDDLRLQPAPEIAKATDFIRRAQESQRTPSGVNGKLFTTLKTDPIAAREMLLEARLEAQTRLGIANPKLISREEADAVLQMPKGVYKDIESKAYLDGVKAAADRFYTTYGPKYGRKAFEDAIGFHLSKEADVKDAGRAMAKVIATYATGGKFPRSGVGAPERPAIATSTETLTGITKYASKTASQTPSEDDVAWALAKPSRQENFDRQFGRGAYARELAKRQQQ
jgi:GH24 family phage-related lysozyme (muramidase)